MGRDGQIQLLKEVFAELSKEQMLSLIERVSHKRSELNNGKVIDDTEFNAQTESSRSGGGLAEVLARVLVDLLNARDMRQNN